MTEFSNFIEQEGGFSLKQLAERKKWEQLTACLTILVQVALVDERYASKEYDSFVKFLLNELELPLETAEKLVGLAEMMHQRGATGRLLDLINRSFPIEGRQALYALIWKTIKADGRVDPAELAAAVDLGKRLNLTLDQEIDARRMVIEQQL